MSDKSIPLNEYVASLSTEQLEQVQQLKRALAESARQDTARSGYGFVLVGDERVALNDVELNIRGSSWSLWVGTPDDGPWIIEGYIDGAPVTNLEELMFAPLNTFHTTSDNHLFLEAYAVAFPEHTRLRLAERQGVVTVCIDAHVVPTNDSASVDLNLQVECEPRFSHLDLAL